MRTGLDESSRLERVQSLVRAFAILDELAAFPEGLSLTDVAKAVRLPRSTVHRLLTTMNSLHYVEYGAGANKWLIGRQAYTLGAAFVQKRDLGRLVRPIMRSLMLDAGEAVYVSVARDEAIEYIDQLRPASASGYVRASNRALPLYASASGKVLLAHWDESTVESYLSSHELRQLTSLTIVAKHLLHAQLEKIREQGYAIDDQEHEIGTRCVAAPVFDKRGCVRASLSISGNVARISEARIAALGGTLASAAKRMSHEVGELITA